MTTSLLIDIEVIRKSSQNESGAEYNTMTHTVANKRLRVLVMITYSGEDERQPCADLFRGPRETS